MADPVLEARDEIRVAVVMYGGVSLAVYMNGITKELLNMVKSTSGAPEADQVSTDKTYRKLAQIISKEPGDDSNWSEKDPVTTRFIIDIISGTSAGGINGIFLAKALANNQDFNSLHDLWIDEGDLAKLINDKKSYQNVGSLPVESQPTSLLNSDRMFIKLYDAFKEMDKPSSDTSPYAKEIDLYVTTTDIRGQVVPLQLYDMFVDERRYKYDFHLRYAGKGSGQQERNDFEPSNNPFLAFAARCTSSFPFAFKPMEFENIQKLVAYRDPHFKIAPEQCSQWKKFLNEYEKRGDENKPREKRFFGDGGYLNNKPFGYVTEAVEHRTTACAVKHRFLFYIEPSPEHPEDDPPYPDAPDAVENATRALFTLPLDQTIREDLHKILNRNRDVRRIARIIEILESQRPTPQAETEKWLKELAPSPNPYELLKVSATTDGLAEILTRAMGFNEKSDEFYAIRCLVKAWREGLYGKSDDKFLQDPDIGYRLRRLRQFLLDFDIGYRLRRLRFLLRKISELSKLDNTAQETLKNVVGPEAVPKPLSTEWTSPFRDELLRAKGGVHLLAQKIQTRINELSARPWPSSGVDATGQPAPRNPLSEAANKLGFTEKDLREILDVPPSRDESRTPFNEADAVLRATDKVREKADQIKVLQDFLKKRFSDIWKEASKQLADELAGRGNELTTPENLALQVLRYYAENFDYFDSTVFPLIYGTDFGELTPIEVVRISPEDAKSIVDERATRGCRHKLMGVKFGHFGAFLEASWRRNDILWGRLDAAERIIQTMLPPRHPQYQQLLSEAQQKIISEELLAADQNQVAGMLAQALLQAGNDRATEAIQQCVQKQVGERVNPKVFAAINAAMTPASLLQSLNACPVVDEEPNRKQLLSSIGRCGQVIGKILEGISKKPPTSNGKVRVPLSWTRWVARVATLFWGFVQVAVPGSLPNWIGWHLFKLLLAFAVVLVLGGLVFSHPMTVFGLELAAIILGGWLIVQILSDYIRFRNMPTLKVSLGLALLVLLALTSLEVSLHLRNDLLLAWTWVTNLVGCPH